MTAQLALIDVTTGDQDTDDLVAMIRGIDAAARCETSNRTGFRAEDVVRVEVAWVCDRTAPFQQQLAQAIMSGFIAWRELVGEVA